MGVKADKTFEDIVERLAALFTLKPRPGERNYEEPVHRALPEPPPSVPSRKKKRNTKRK